MTVDGDGERHAVTTENVQLKHNSRERKVGDRKRRRGQAKRVAVTKSTGKEIS